MIGFILGNNCRKSGDISPIRELCLEERTEQTKHLFSKVKLLLEMLVKVHKQIRKEKEVTASYL